MSDVLDISSMFPDLFGFDFMLLVLLSICAVIFIPLSAQKLTHGNLSFRDTLVYLVLIIGLILSPIYMLYHIYLSSGFAEFLPLTFSDFLMLTIFSVIYLGISAFAHNN
ncbi:hypothetical protein DU67_18605 [Methanosarcina mazei]|uniref:Uncharacterized protein n=1 Tax=Methanosarcina mazei TaxID=2209 RepID=A0A0F8H5G4_METMZ|nr:hypothetical protein DU67_18605 [Methanosarcina mazei]